MLAAFLPIFVAETKIIFVYNFVAPLRYTIIPFILHYFWSAYLSKSFSQLVLSIFGFLSQQLMTEKTKYYKLIQKY